MAAASLESLRSFFETAPAARAATRPLARSAEVGLLLEEGPARFTMESGRPQVLPGEPRDPDFTLTLTPAAVARVVALAGAGVGELGIEFFQLAISSDPAAKARIRIHASTARLLSHGYLGVLALGGMKVGWWLLRNGVKNPKAAFDRFRRG